LTVVCAAINIKKIFLQENQMNRFRVVFVLLLFAIGASACGAIPEEININVNGESTQDVDQIVAATFAAMTQQAGQPAQNIASTPTAQDQQPPAAGTGGVSGTDNIPTNTPPGGVSGGIAGALSYPSQFIPEMAVIAFHTGGGPSDYYYVTTQQNQSTYQINGLPPGNYTVIAYVLGGGLAGGYTQAVPCGLLASCADHSLIQVTVQGGQVTQNVNPQDWYAPADAFPAYPLP
jgi:hypothetical protein